VYGGSGGKPNDVIQRGMQGLPKPMRPSRLSSPKSSIWRKVQDKKSEVGIAKKLVFLKTHFV
jgi:hypothetical protein